MRRSPTLPLAAVLLACASAAPAQSSRASAPLVVQTGSPLAFRIGFPSGWQVERRALNVAQTAQVQGGTVTNTVRVAFPGEAMSVTNGTVFIQLLVMDVVPVKRPELPVSWSEQRRITTNTILGSDSLLFGLLDNGARNMGTGFSTSVREIRTLGGQRSAYLGGRLVVQGQPSRVEMHVTMKDGIAYVLTFAEDESRFAAREALFTRVRDSLVFAENAPVSPPE